MFDKAVNQQNENERMEELVVAASSGDREALQRLCSKIAKDVLYQVTFILGGKEGVEDVSQEVLIRVCKSIHNLRDPKAFKGWLSLIIINEKNRYLEKHIKRSNVLDINDYLENLVEEADDYLPSICVEKAELRNAVMDVVMGLPARQREAVVLRYFNDLSVAEVAEAMDVTAPCVSQYLALAFKKIKRSLEEHPAMPESMFAAMPIGIVLSSALSQDATIFEIANLAYVESIVASCNEVILTEQATIITVETTAKTGASYASSGKYVAVIVGICCAAVTAAAIAVTAHFAAYPYQDYLISPELPAAMEIIFQGGQSRGANYAHVNPTSVSVYGGDMSVINWRIVEASSGNIVLAGDGETASSALAELKRDGISGEHIMYFQMESESWTPHTVRENFYIFP